MDCSFISSVPPETIWMTVMIWLPCLWWISCICLCGIFVLYMTPCPMVMLLFQPIYKSVNVISNLVLLNLSWEIPLWKKIPVSSESGFAVTLEYTIYNLGTFWVLTNWRRWRGRKCLSALGERQRLREISVGKQEFQKQKEVVYLPWRLLWGIVSEFNERHSGFKKTYTR